MCMCIYSSQVEEYVYIQCVLLQFFALFYTHIDMHVGSKQLRFELQYVHDTHTTPYLLYTAMMTTAVQCRCRNTCALAQYLAKKQVHTVGTLLQRFKHTFTCIHILTHINTHTQAEQCLKSTNLSRDFSPFMFSAYDLLFLNLFLHCSFSFIF